VYTFTILILNFNFVVFLFVIQASESKSEQINKTKKKKLKKLVKKAAQDVVQAGHSEVTNGIENGERIQETPVKFKFEFSKDTPSKAGSGVNVNSGPEAGRRAKKKSVISSAANGCGTKPEKFSDVERAVKCKSSKDSAIHQNDDTNKHSLSQTDSCLKSSTTAAVDKKRKRKKKTEKKLSVGLNSVDGGQEVDEHCSKKLKTDDESSCDKTVVSTSSVEPGSFENYHISTSMAEKLQCMYLNNINYKFFS